MGSELDITNIGTWLHDVGYDRTFLMWITSERNADPHIVRIIEAFEIAGDVMIGVNYIYDDEQTSTIYYYRLAEIHLAYTPPKKESDDE